MKLRGENLYVKPVKEGDASALLKLEVKNKAFFQAFTGARDPSFYTLEGQEKRVTKAVRAWQEDKEYLFLICSHGSNDVIGQITLSEVVRANLQGCWIGYFLDQEHNGKGHMTEAVKLTVTYALEELNFHRIEAGVMPHNTGSMRVLLKAGFQKEGIARKNVKVNGRWEDHQTLAIIEDDLDI